MGILVMIFGVLMISAEHVMTTLADRTEGIPDAPAVSEFTIQATHTTACGFKIIARDQFGKPAVFYTKAAHIVKIARGIGSPDFESWIDSDGDGVLDSYYSGTEGAGRVLALCPDPCKL